MGQQLQTQPAVHTGVPGIQAPRSSFAGMRGSLAVPMAPGAGVPPPSMPQPQFTPAVARAPVAPVGAPGTMPAPVAPPPHPYALALRNSRAG